MFPVESCYPSQRFPLSSLAYMGGYGILAMGAASSGALPSHRLLLLFLSFLTVPLYPVFQKVDMVYR